MLLGQTLAGMQVYDAVRALASARTLEGLAGLPVHGHASPGMTEVAAFAALFQEGVTDLTLAQAVRRDTEAADFLNWSRWVTPGQLMDLVRGRCALKIGEE